MTSRWQVGWRELAERTLIWDFFHDSIWWTANHLVLITVLSTNSPRLRFCPCCALLVVSIWLLKNCSIDKQALGSVLSDSFLERWVLCNKASNYLKISHRETFVIISVKLFVNITYWTDALPLLPKVCMFSSVNLWAEQPGALWRHLARLRRHEMMNSIRNFDTLRCTQVCRKYFVLWSSLLKKI